MILSAEELEVLDYLKSWKGKFVTMVEICRCAGGRQKYRENPNWAKNFMSRLVESGEIAVNDRGHYRWLGDDEATGSNPAKPGSSAASATNTYRNAAIVGDNYFPSADATGDADGGRWVSPQIAAILQRSGKKFGQPK